MRKSTIKRETKETTIEATLVLDGSGKSEINTPILFFNHLLDSFVFYSGCDVTLNATGDIEVDDHHLVEDIGIVLGTLFKEALGDKIGITRFSSNFTPMDEALVQTVLDISNRPKLVANISFTREKISNFSLENVYEFLYAFAIESRITLHQSVMYGANNHHIAEALFKSLGRALKEAVTIQTDNVTSTKGTL